MLSTEDRPRVRYWRPDSPSVTAMLRVERDDRPKTTYADLFAVVAVYEGAFETWCRGAPRAYAAGTIKLSEPGDVHRGLRVHAPYTLQYAGFSAEIVAEAASSLGLRAPVHLKTPRFDAGERASQLAFAMHAALARADAPEIERATRVVEVLSEILSTTSHASAMHGGSRAPRAVHRARAFLHDALADKITLDALAEHAGLDKFHLVRAFRVEVGLPPYEYLTHARVSRAKELLQRGARVADAAQAVGFYDESQLHRHFRRIVGITPGRFSKSFTSIQHRPSRGRAMTARSSHERSHSH